MSSFYAFDLGPNEFSDFLMPPDFSDMPWTDALKDSWTDLGASEGALLDSRKDWCTEAGFWDGVLDASGSAAFCPIADYDTCPPDSFRLAE